MLKTLLFSLVNKFGYNVVKATPNSQIINLLNSLRPYKFDLIRFGGSQDGGYLIPNDIDGITYLVSPGVSDVSTFETDCLKNGIEVYMYDASISKPNIVLDKQTHFYKQFVKNYIKSQSETTLNRILDSINTAGDGILQLDIENFEYEVILGTDLEVLKKFRIVVVEFHSFDQLFSLAFFSLISTVFNKLLENHSVVHFHPNYECGSKSNSRITLPRACEITFLRKDRVINNEIIDFNTHILDHTVKGKDINDYIKY
jgi:hypothetical protein